MAFEQRYLTIEQAAAYMGMAAKTVRVYIDKRPEALPPFIVLCNPSGKWRTIRFDRVDLDAWMNLRKNRRTIYPLALAK